MFLRMRKLVTFDISTPHKQKVFMPSTATDPLLYWRKYIQNIMAIETRSALMTQNIYLAHDQAKRILTQKHRK
jgi:hypothetical protein